MTSTPNQIIAINTQNPILIIQGQFSTGLNPSFCSVSLNLGSNCSVISINSTTIICQFSQLPNQTGSLNATLNPISVSFSSNNVQIATIVEVSINSNSSFLASNASDILITGNGFSPNSTIYLFPQGSSGNSPACSSIDYISFNQIICQEAQNLTNGGLFAQILNSFGGYSSHPSNQTQIATIDDSPILDPSLFSITPINSNQILINGNEFSPNYWENSVELFDGNGNSISSSLFSISSLSNQTDLILDFGNYSLLDLDFKLENISAIVLKWNGRRISSNQPILVSKIVPFIEPTISNYLAINFGGSITINGEEFVSSINNNTQIQVNLIQSSAIPQPSCSSISFVDSYQIICEAPQNLIPNQDLFATILIDSEWNSTFQTQTATIVPRPTIITCSNLSLNETGFLVAQVSSFGGNSSYVSVSQIVNPPFIIPPNPILQLFTNDSTAAILFSKKIKIKKR